MTQEIDTKEILTFCKKLGCCSGCSLRFSGNKNPAAYDNPRQYVANFLGISDPLFPVSPNPPPPLDENGQPGAQANGHTAEELEQRYKKRKLPVCVTCLGILQEQNWMDSMDKVKYVLEKKRYVCTKFACGLSYPMCILLREKAILLNLIETFRDYDPRIVTSLKEAWKWTVAYKMAVFLDMTLESGVVAPLLITLNMEYVDDLIELETLRALSPGSFPTRQFSRRGVERALADTRLSELRARGGGAPEPRAHATCAAVSCVHVPAYLGGRYVKLSRELPQTPWLVNGERMMDSSVQEIIFGPIAKLYQLNSKDAEQRLKFMAAGREDVDVRCLGEGRPFAVEIADPRRELTPEELERACREISSCGRVLVQRLVPVTRDELAQLKEGEETKCKTYEALCIKLEHAEGENEDNKDLPITVTEKDLENINSYRNTPEGDEARIVIKQKTPIRVLHRRPLLTRTRRIYEVQASAVPGHPQLFRLRVRTEAGTYVKEWAHGELGRSAPALPHAVRARADLLALDVAAVHLAWPRRD